MRFASRAAVSSALFAALTLCTTLAHAQSTSVVVVRIASPEDATLAQQLLAAGVVTRTDATRVESSFAGQLEGARVLCREHTASVVVWTEWAPLEVRVFLFHADTSDVLARRIPREPSTEATLQLAVSDLRSVLAGLEATGRLGGTAPPAQCPTTPSCPSCPRPVPCHGDNDRQYGFRVGAGIGWLVDGDGRPLETALRAELGLRFEELELGFDVTLSGNRSLVDGMNAYTVNRLGIALYGGWRSPPLEELQRDLQLDLFLGGRVGLSTWSASATSLVGGAMAPDYAKSDFGFVGLLARGHLAITRELDFYGLYVAFGVDFVPTPPTLQATLAGGGVTAGVPMFNAQPWFGVGFDVEN